MGLTLPFTLCTSTESVGGAGLWAEATMAKSIMASKGNARERREGCKSEPFPGQAACLREVDSWKFSRQSRKTFSQRLKRTAIQSLTGTVNNEVLPAKQRFRKRR